MKIRIAIDLKINRVVKYFILVDLALLAGWGLIEPIFSIFVVQKIAGATLTTVGIAAAIYWLLKSALQLPLANFLDRRRSEKSKLYALIFGLLVLAVSAFSFSLITTITGLYVVQILHSLGFALYVASWPALFSRHLDKDRVSYDWALDSTAAGVSAGVAAFFGSIIANQFGFGAVFVLAAVFSAISAIILFFAPDLVLPRPTTASTKFQDHTPANIGH